MHDPTRRYGHVPPVTLSEIEEVFELPPNAELLLALGEAVADEKRPERVQQDGVELHLRLGEDWRIRAKVVEVVKDQPGVQAPPLRNTSLVATAERRRLTALLTRLGASQEIDVAAMNEKTLVGLRRTLETLTARNRALVSDVEDQAGRTDATARFASEVVQRSQRLETALRQLSRPAPAQAESDSA